MGCAASKKAVDPGPPGPGPRPAKPLEPLTPEAQAAAQARTVRLLESLAATEFLGAAHQYTVKWQRVLEGMSAGS